MSKTGGGPGTNQYKVRGTGKAGHTHGGLPDQGECQRHGDCVWPGAGLDDAWCLVHRQLAPELRELAGLTPCVARLSPQAQNYLVRTQSAATLGPWVGHLTDTDLRVYAASAMPLDRLDWAVADSAQWVRRAAAERWPLDQLSWVIQDPSWEVRAVAARRLSPDQLGWATTDQAPEVRQIAAERLPLDQLGWAAQDEDRNVRRAAAKRMPVDQLQWASLDDDVPVRQVAARRMPLDQLGWAIQDDYWQVRQVAARRMPVRQLRWAIQDRDWRVVKAATDRIPRRSRWLHPRLEAARHQAQRRATRSWAQRQADGWGQGDWPP